MEILLKAKPWQIFILLIIGLIVSNYTLVNNPIITSILSIIGGVIYFIYPFSVGHCLQEYLPQKIKLSHNFFLFNTFIWAVIYSSITIISDGRGMNFSGLMAIPMLYVFFAFLHFLAFPALTIKSIELNKKASFGEYIGDFFLILFLPIGIWFLQPRIKQILDNKEIID